MNQRPDPETTIGELGEKAVIAEIAAAAPSSRNGDDAAVLSLASPNSRTVAATDMLVEGRHFLTEWSTPEEIGQKAVTANFADIEAMGARPICALLALAAPASTPIGFLRGLAAGIARGTGEHSAELVGGDITLGDRLIISITAIGSLGGSLPALTQDCARPGQKLVAHGLIGHSAAGFALLERYGRDDVPARFTPLIDAHCAPRLTPGRGVVARAAGATSMTDNSDGLIADLGDIARKSQVGIEVFSHLITPDPLLLDAASDLDVDPWEWVLTGGEDHTLLGTTNEKPPSGFRTIGAVTRTGAVTVDGEDPYYDTGWVSF